MSEKYRNVTFQWSASLLEEPTDELESEILHLVCEDEEQLGMEVFGVSIEQTGLNAIAEHESGEYQPYVINVKVKTHLQSMTDHFCLDKSMVEMTESRVREILPEAAEVGAWHILLHHSK